MMRVITLVLGIIAIMLGGLWLLQGLGIVHMRPILCFADCAPVQGSSVIWAIIGSVTLAVGGICIGWPKRKSEK